MGINDASILWMCMLCQPYICAPEYCQSFEKFVITDSYYTRHIWALGLSVMSDKKVWILGTVKFNYIDKYLQDLVKEKLKEFKDIEQGTWCLIRCWHVKGDYKEQEKAHKAQECARIAKLKGKKNLKMAPFKPQLEVSENCAFLLFKDWKTVLFYTSALNGTMPCDIINSTDPMAKKFVYGLYPLKQWTDDSMGMRNTLMAP